MRPAAGEISIHALRKESDEPDKAYRFQQLISIHALRKESDFHRHIVNHKQIISIHALRKESDALHRN